MKSGDSVPAATDHSSRQLQDIEELVAKLKLVTKQLQLQRDGAAQRDEARQSDPS